MMKIVASLVILGLCANVVFGAGVAPSASTQSSALSSTYLNSSVYTVYSAANSTDAVIFDSSAAASGSTAAVQAGIISAFTWFGPGTSNDTSYVYGIPSTGYSSATAAGSNPGSSTPTIYTTSSIKKRTINNTIVGWANDTKEYAVVSDTAISTTILGTPSLGASAIAPGYLALLTASYDSTTAAAVNEQIYFTLINGASGSASVQTVTKNADVTAASTTAGCTETTVGTGNVWYDIGTGAFFFTYWVNVQTQDYQTGTATACTGTTATAAQAVVKTSVYLQGYYLNGTAYFTSPISVAAATAGNSISSLRGGSDNWLNSTNIYVAYVDTTASPSNTYYSKTTKASTTSALGSFSSLIKSTTATPVTGTTVTMTYVPVSVWTSNNTYGITVSNATRTVVASPASDTSVYGFVNFINGSTTGVDSGLSVSQSTGAGAFWGWPQNTGYSVIGAFSTSTGVSYQYATYYANGTANQTAGTLGTLTYSTPQLYEDVNGTMWVSWQDVDTANSVSPGGTLTYAGYLAKLQGQINVPSGASVLSAISAFFALFLAAIFVF